MYYLQQNDQWIGEINQLFFSVRVMKMISYTHTKSCSIFFVIKERVEYHHLQRLFVKRVSLSAYFLPVEIQADALNNQQIWY